MKRSNPPAFQHIGSFATVVLIALICLVAVPTVADKSKALKFSTLKTGTPDVPWAKPVPAHFGSLLPVPPPAGTINVNSTLQSPGVSGDCTLGEAIMAANTNLTVDGCSAGSSAADTIMLPAGTYTLTRSDSTHPFYGAVGLPGITSDVVVQGAGSGSTIIERSDGATEQFRLMLLGNGIGSVVLNDLTMRQGKSDKQGGALYTGGRPATFNRVVFNNNQAQTGGAVVTNDQGGAVIANDCIFTNNQAIGGNGGAIVGSPVTISNSTFTGNSAVYGGALFFIQGGAANFNIADSTFTNNHATATGGIGGAIYVAGVATILRSLFNGNSAGSSGSSGGALAGNVCTLNLIDSVVTGNQATSGGGLHLSNSSFNISRSTISNNTASTHFGGGIYANAGGGTISASTINGNTSGINGGGIWGADINLTLSNVTVDGNTAIQGGGIYYQDFPGTKAVTLNNVTITGNHATNHGGGLFRASGAITFRNSIFALNTSDINLGPDIYADSIFSGGYNLVGIKTGANFSINVGDRAGDPGNPINPLLGPLQNNGGTTFTRALLAGSPALDAASPAVPGTGGAACEPSDQRGVSRPQDGDNNGSAICDIGAYEQVRVPLCIPPPSGLVAWWPFDGNAHDIQGFDPATLVGDPTFATGKVDQALNFDGIDDHAVIPAASALDIGSAGGMTFGVWIKPPEIQTARPLIEWNSGTGPHLWMSADFGEGGQGVGSLFVNLTDITGSFHIFSSAPGLLTANTWQHVAVTYDKTLGIAKIYLNGTAVAQQNLGSFTPQTGVDLYLGYRPEGVLGGRRFLGSMDEVELFNRALEATEIQAIYYADYAGKCKPDCEYLISPSHDKFTSAGGPGTLSVAVGAGCAWTAVTTDPFITITAGVSGSGNGAVNYSVAANSASARTATITIAGKTFKVDQTAATSTTLAASPNPANPGQAVTLKATVSAVNPGTGTPGGTVTFREGTTTLGQATLGAGSATFITSSLALGAHNITAGYEGDASFDAGTSNAVTVTVEVKPPNRPPIARADIALVAERTFVDIPVLANDEDPDGDTLSVVELSAPSFGTAYVGSNQMINYRAIEGRYEDSFTYTIDDGHGERASATVTVRVLRTGSDLGLSLAPAVVAARPDSLVTLTIQVENPSIEPSGGATVLVALPPHTTFLDSTPASTAVGSTARQFAVPALGAGASTSLRIRLRTDPSSSGQVLFSASLNPLGIDADGQNNEATGTLVFEPDFCFLSSQGLLARWRGDQTASEDLGRFRLTGGRPEFGVGYIQQAFAFDGISGGLTFETDTPPPQQFTVSAWVAPGNNAGLSPVVGESGRYLLGFQDGHPKLLIYQNGVVAASAMASEAVEPGSWVHLAATFDGHTARLYVSGIEKSTTPVAFSLVQSGLGTLVLGGYSPDPGLPDLHFNGLIDDVIRHGHVLSPEDIARLLSGVPEACRPATSASLALAASASPSLVPVLGVVTLSLTVTNTSAGSIPEGIELVNELPELFVFADASAVYTDASVPAYVTEDGRPHFAIGPLIAGESRTIEVRLIAPSVDGYFVNRAVAQFLGVEAAAETTIVVEPRSCFMSPTGLVGYWPFEPEPDGSQYTVVGRVGYAYSHGSEPYSFVTSSPLSSATAMTLAAWVQPAKPEDGSMTVAMISRTNPEDFGVEDARFFLGISHGRAVLVTSHADGQHTTTAAEPLVAGHWYHLAGSFDGTTARLYVNGALVAETVVGLPLTPAGETEIPAIGREYLGIGRGFVGLIDEVVAYDRALTGAAIQALTAGSPATCKVNARPTLINPGPQTSKIGEATTLALTASDPDPADVVTFKATGLPAGLVIDSATGRIAGSPTLSAVGAHNVTVTVTDGRLSAKKSFTWTVLSRLTVRVARGALVDIGEGRVCDATAGPLECVWDVLPSNPILIQVTVSPDLSGAVQWIEENGVGLSDSGELSVENPRTLDIMFLRYFEVDFTGTTESSSSLLKAVVNGGNPLVPMTTVPNFYAAREILYVSPSNPRQVFGRAVVGSQVGLTAKNAAITDFAGWTGVCSGFECSFVLDQSGKVATATYRPRFVTMTLDVGAGGSVTVNETAVADRVCAGGATGATCAMEVRVGSELKLTPALPGGWEQHWRWNLFVGESWEKDTSSKPFTVTAARHIGVVFQVPLIVETLGWGSSFDSPVSEPYLASWTCQRHTVPFVLELEQPVRLDQSDVQCRALVDFGSTFAFALWPQVPARLTFAGWDGDCSGTGACQVTANRATPAVVATFFQPVTLEPAAHGGIAVNGALACDGGLTGRTCVLKVPDGNDTYGALTLSARPAAGYSFSGWGNACTGLAQCTVRTDGLFGGGTTVAARFNGVPVIKEDILRTTVRNNQIASVTVTAIDPEGDSLRAEVASAPLTGVASAIGMDLFYLPQAGFVGTDSFTYTVRDGFGRSTPGTVVVTVTEVPNTPVGKDVTYLDGGLLGIRSWVTFGTVTEEGRTTVTYSSTGAGYPPPPDGFRVGDLWFDVSTTAAYTPPVEVCAVYNPALYANPASLRFMHYENGQWVDQTSLNNGNGLICGIVKSLSPFIVAEPINQAPTANAGPAQTLEATSPSGAVVTLDASASSDPDGDALTFTWSGPFGSLNGPIVSATVPIGTHTITLTVDDGRGGRSTGTTIVRVVDTTAPAITGLKTDKTSLWPPDHKMVDIAVSYAATDAADLAPRCVLVVSSNEAILGTGDGDIAPDWVITDAHHVQLRAERAGTGSGRVYTIGITCSDASGNASTRSVAVSVSKTSGVVRFRAPGRWAPRRGNDHVTRGPRATSDILSRRAAHIAQPLSNPQPTQNSWITERPGLEVAKNS